jgi:hypothetical protein
MHERRANRMKRTEHQDAVMRSTRRKRLLATAATLPAVVTRAPERREIRLASSDSVKARGPSSLTAIHSCT